MHASKTRTLKNLINKRISCVVETLLTNAEFRIHYIVVQ